MTSKTIIALAGAGDLAKYIVDAAVSHGNVQVVVLSRSSKDWFEKRSPDVSLHVTDYSAASVREILDATGATALFSVIHTFDAAVYLETHRALLEAVGRSRSCRRFSPSYYAGNIDDFPGVPRFYEDAHQAFHDEMERTAGRGGLGLEWTVINQGWIMDYVAIFEEEGRYGDKSYMKSAQTIWSINMKDWTATIPGTGDEPATFTAAADVGKAVVALGVTSKPWPKHTYLQGEQTTWNRLVKELETFYDRKLVDVKYRPLDQIQNELQSLTSQDDLAHVALLQTSEWIALGGQGLPQDAVLAQRDKYFAGIRFQTVEELLAASAKGRI
ncbi:hypothetical protein V2A60_004280 [Cordyceps javanica]|uniref:Nmra-like protein n=1 Tax=Cordyceps javanica TaxID=43265 RepID=A0A545ULK7_9HYPO|nr:nmra-like protein [Cordyceps javanica]TQW01804.1 nmra-like protein [Cordyceps javanica]